RAEVAGETKVRQRRESHVVRATDAALEHAAAPHGNLVALADVVDRLGDGEAADASRLDVDDLSRAELDHIGGTIDVSDRLIETDARLEALLQLGVPNDIIAS